MFLFIVTIVFCLFVPAQSGCLTVNAATGLCASCEPNTFGATCSRNGYNEQIESLDIPELVICCVIIALLVSVWSVFIWGCVWADDEGNDAAPKFRETTSTPEGHTKVSSVLKPEPSSVAPQPIVTDEPMVIQPTVNNLRDENWRARKSVASPASQSRSQTIRLTRSTSPQRGGNGGRAPSPSHDGIDGGARLINKSRNDDDPSYRHGKDTQRNLSPSRQQDSRAAVEPPTLTHPNGPAQFGMTTNSSRNEPFWNEVHHDPSCTGGVSGPGGRTQLKSVHQPKNPVQIMDQRMYRGFSDDEEEELQVFQGTRRRSRSQNGNQPDSEVRRGGVYGPYYPTSNTDIPQISRRSPVNKNRNVKMGRPDFTDVEAQFPFQGGSKRSTTPDDGPNLHFSLKNDERGKRVNVFPPPNTLHSRK